MSEPVAFDIYERLEMNAEGQEGSVWNDLFGGECMPPSQISKTTLGTQTHLNSSR
jgi:hypothetical protein